MPTVSHRHRRLVRRRLWLTATLCLAPAALPAQQRPDGLTSGTTVLRGVTVIDGTGAAPLRDAVVAVRDGRIEHVGPSRAYRSPAGAREMNLGGRFVVPGFIDMHAHLAFGPVFSDTATPPTLRMEYDDAASREMASTLLAFGVTTARNPGGPTAQTVALRDLLRAGRHRGPRLYTAGDVLDIGHHPGITTKVTTEAEVRAEVARQAAAGVDYIKVYVSLAPPLVRAAIDEAHRHRIKAIGHLMFTSWTEAATMGIDGIVHVIPGTPVLLPAARRAEFLKGIRGTQFMYQWFQYVDLDSPEIAEMAKALAANRVSLDPTLVIFEAMFRGDDPAVIKSPDLWLAPLSLARNWRNDFTLTQAWSAAEYRAARAQWPTVLRFVKKLHDSGVLLTAGTDVPNPWVIPGVSFHRELRLLADAGIPPLDVLRIATRNGAESLGIAAEVGTVEAGKRADLVVLEADPLADIGNTRRIAWVMQGGELIRPASLLPPRRAAP